MAREDGRDREHDLSHVPGRPKLRRQLAALNVRAEASTLEAARSLGWGLLRFDAGYEGRGDRIARAVRGQKRPPRALYHEGAFGIEPIMYVVGPSATDVVAQTEALGSRL